MNLMQGSLQSGRILSTLFEPLVLAVANLIAFAVGFLCRPHIDHLGWGMAEFHYTCTSTFDVAMSGFPRPRVIDGQYMVK